MEKIQIFLSYAHDDLQEAEKLYAKLVKEGYKIWMDKKNILPGEIWEHRILEAIDQSDFFIFCLSESSIQRRGVLQKELKFALDKWEEKLEDDIYLIPVKFEECESPESLKKLQWVELYEQDGFNKLNQALKKQKDKQTESKIKKKRERKEFYKWLLGSGKKHVALIIIGIMLASSIFTVRDLAKGHLIQKKFFDLLQEELKESDNANSTTNIQQSINILKKLDKNSIINLDSFDTAIKSVNNSPIQKTKTYEKVFKDNESRKTFNDRITVAFWITYICLMHIILIFIFVVAMPPPPGFNNRVRDEETEHLTMSICGYTDEKSWALAKKTADEALHQFEYGWTFIWYTWLMLYIFFFATNIYDFFTSEIGTKVFQNFLNNLTALMFAFCYLVLTKPTIRIKADGTSVSPNWFFLKILIPTVVVFAFLEGIMEVISFGSFIGFNFKLDPFGVLSGLISGAITALFVGRLDSKFIQVPTSVLIILYLYSAMQALFVILVDYPNFTLALLAFALFGKCVIYLLMAWLFHSGQILFYFVRIRNFFFQVHNDWNTFSKYLKHDNASS